MLECYIILTNQSNILNWWTLPVLASSTTKKMIISYSKPPQGHWNTQPVVMQNRQWSNIKFTLSVSHWNTTQIAIFSRHYLLLNSASDWIKLLYGDCRLVRLFLAGHMIASRPIRSQSMNTWTRFNGHVITVRTINFFTQVILL